MTRVVVVGGGTVGREAAAEASRNGAEVLLYERHDRWEPPWREWPGLILSPDDLEPSTQLPNAVELAYGKDVSCVGSDFVLISDGTKVRFDSVVLTTGAEFRRTAFPGRKKPGVITLDSTESCCKLGRERSSMDHVIVQGDGIQAMRVAEALSETGKKLTVIASPGTDKTASATIGSVISEAAAQRGISIINARLESAVGREHVEAVVAGGSVIPCDVLAVLPRRVPQFPRVAAETGPNGGLLVDGSLRSSSPFVYSAGVCAEFGGPWSFTGIPDVASAMSGRVAGANATGHAHVVRHSHFASSLLFGLSWARAGVGLGEARSRGLEASEVCRRWSLGSACSIVFERRSGRILGVELVTEELDERLGVLAALTPSFSLRTVAYGASCDSSDISMLSDTARLGLQAWSGS
jgi:pyruvate/2-oxoglutarate dehydrogenase complex dihydrolipoamide dehydrogenase (E3) component